MLEKITDILKTTNYVFPCEILKNYKKLNMSSEELILIIYLINNINIFNPKQISEDLSIDLNQVMENINNLVTKGLISIDMHKVGNVRSEYINLNEFYNKLAFNMIETKEKEVPNNIYDIFEKEFGRTLSPMEYEIIGAWASKTDEETILLALKEATYNGVSNLRYIDKILSEWSKKGIKKESDIIKKSTRKTESFDYDWLNDNE